MRLITKSRLSTTRRRGCTTLWKVSPRDQGVCHTVPTSDSFNIIHPTIELLLNELLMEPGDCSDAWPVASYALVLTSTVTTTTTTTTMTTTIMEPQPHVH